MLPNRSILLETVCAFIFLPLSLAQSYDNAKALRSAILANYHKDIRPLTNQSHVVNVNVSMVLYGMPEVDDVKGVISLVAATAVTWYDEIISWNPADYGGITSIPILMDEVWTPSISLGNPIEFATMGQSQSHVTFYANGLAFFYPGAVLKSSCTFNMKFWPFDKQICHVMFLPMDYTLDKVILSTPDSVTNTNLFVPNSEWTIEEIEAYAENKIENAYSIAYFRLKLKRQSLFYVLTLILPLTGTGALTCLVFLLPSAAGERISYAVTIMLALAVFLTVVSTELPKTSEPISLLCVSIFFGVMVSVFGTVVAILSLILYHREESVPKGAWYKFLVRLSQCKGGNKVGEIGKTEEENRSNRKNDPRDRTTTNISTFVAVKAVDSYKQNDDEEITWQQVSIAIDRMTIMVMIIFAYVPTLIFIIYIGCASSYQD